MSARTDRGFTLTELAVVLAVLALLIGGMLTPLGAQIEARSRRDTETALTTIREALLGFAVIHGRLPCPARPTLANGSGGDCPVGGNAAVAGCEATRGTGTTLACELPSGVLPWATLGLPETDAWGNRYTYRVGAVHARGIDPAQSDFGDGCTLNPADRHSYDAALADAPRQAAFAICTPGDIEVQAAAGTTLATKLPAVIVSHGRNGSGAYTSLGVRLAAVAGDETENADDDARFVAGAGGDDLLQWLPPGLLVSRMMAAGKLP